MADWSAGQYLKFEDERTRPARDLLARIPLAKARKIADLGCGPGNSTELLLERFPAAEVIGVDSSPAMLAETRKRLPQCRFIEADVGQWRPEQGTDLLFANAVFHWVRDHAAVLARFAGTLSPGGVLAVQMPDNLEEPLHLLAAKNAREGPWAARLARVADVREQILDPAGYYDVLKPGMSQVDIWRTEYNHPLDGPDGIVEWNKGTGLRPYLDPLDAETQKSFLATMRAGSLKPIRGAGTVGYCCASRGFLSLLSDS